MSNPQQLPPPNSARLAITSLCKVLHHHGVTCLEPEIVRQAKFDGPVAAPLWRALHDTVLLLLAGCVTAGELVCPVPAGAGTAKPGAATSGAVPPTRGAAAGPGPVCGAALERQWARVASELASSAEEGFPQEAAAFVLHHLAAWGAPPALLRQLRCPRGGNDGGAAAAAAALRGPAARASSGEGLHPDAALSSSSSAEWAPLEARSRPLLLALGWLVAAGRLFESRIEQLEPGPEARALLPPYPPDACAAPGTQAAYEAAAQEATDRVRRLPAGSEAAAPASAIGGAGGGGGSGGGSGGGGGGSYHGAARAQARSRGSSAADAEGLWAEVEAAAQRAVALCGRVRGRMVALQAATDCRNRLTASLWSRQAAASSSSRPLTPYELQLCAHPASVQRHVSALEAATLALLEQQELAAHGALFFEWLGSVIEEEEAAAAGREGPQAPGHKERSGAAAGRPGRDGGGGSGHQQAPLSSLESLPLAGSSAAARLDQHLADRLAAALQAAEPELSAARRRRQAPASTAPGRPQGAGAASPGVTLQRFLSLAERAVPEQLPDLVPDGGDGAGLDGVGSTAGSDAAATPKLPLLCHIVADGGGGGTGAAAAGPWRLPDDVAAAMASAHDNERRRRCTAAEDADRFRTLRYAALARYDFSLAAAAAAAGGPLSGMPPPSPLQATATGTAAAGAAVPAPDDTQRLLAAVLAAARLLARTRAGHKAALLAALQDLPDGYLVAGL